MAESNVPQVKYNLIVEQNLTAEEIVQIKKNIQKDLGDTEVAFIESPFAIIVGALFYMLLRKIL